MTTRPEPTPCDGVGFDRPDWPGPWGCGTVWWEAVNDVVTRHQCALSYDHVHYRDEPHVCTEGHRCDVERPRRRWRDRLLRRPVEELPRRRGGFWADLDRHLEDPEFRRACAEQSLRLQAGDKQADAGNNTC